MFGIMECFCCQFLSTSLKLSRRFLSYSQALLPVSSARLPEIVLYSGELLLEAGKQSDLSVYGTYGGARVKIAQFLCQLLLVAADEVSPGFH